MCASLFNGLFDPFDFMATQIIHHNDITRMKGWYKTLLNIFLESFSI